MVAKVLAVEAVDGQKKPIRWVTLTDGTDERQVICGATNFEAGDVIAYARPPAVLPGGVEITARTTYGHLSDGMICSGRELGISDEHDGILRLDPGLELGIDVVSALGLRDDVLDISINPDRGLTPCRCAAWRGRWRRRTASGSVIPVWVQSPIPDGGAYDVRVESADGCSRFVARLVTALDPATASPAWLARRLVMAGMRPISLMVDVTNYVMLDLGQPMHAYDRAALSGPIVVRWAQPGETLRTLDDVERALDPRDLVIADDTGPIGLAGVMGGAATEIRATTTEVVLEAAAFDPVSVSYSARRHRLGSEASRRFERGVDNDLPRAAAQAAVALIESLGAGKGLASVTDVDLREAPATILLDPELPGRIAGVAYAATTVEDRLTDIGCTITSQPGGLEVSPPPWRPDLTLPVDLVEEVVRLEGYSTLPATVPKAPAGRGLTRPQRLRRQIGRLLADTGYVEVLTSPFVDAGSAARLQLEPGDPRVPSVRIANPVSDEEPFLRTTLLPGLFGALVRNVGRGLSDVALFETGPVFRTRPGMVAPPVLPAGVRPSEAELAALDAALPDQPHRIAAVLTGARSRVGWWGPARPADWSDAIAAARGPGGDRRRRDRGHGGPARAVPPGSVRRVARRRRAARARR